MSGSTRQSYLERARATLAARESWRSVFEPQPTTPDSECTESGGRGDHAVSKAAPTRGGDAESSCDKSDKSDHSPTVNTDDQAGIAWRVEAMRRQIRPGPIIPFLVARCDFVDTSGGCLSCGDPRGPGRRYRCGPCVRAAEIVVNEAWEGRDRWRTDAPQEDDHDQ
jgi:hypothetical protein